LKRRRLAGACQAERATFDETYAVVALAIRVGERIRDAMPPLDLDSYLE
jgi:hypothetical protein